MKLIRTSLLNGIAVFIKLLTLLGINKLLAIYVGPTGYAALGQFQNAITMLTTFASGAINTGVTKYTAEYYDEPLKQQAIWRTASTVALIGSLLSSILIAAWRKPMAQFFLHDEAYSGVFLWFSGMLLFFVFNTLLLAILNGKKEIGRYITANITGSLIALCLTTFLTITYGLYGALIALAIYQSVAFFVTVVLCYQAEWFQWSYFFGALDKKVVKKLSGYTLMALSSAVCIPLSHIFIRQHLSSSFGIEAAGYWEAMWRVSAAYLMLITTTLSVYYLPRLSEISDASELKKEIFYGYKVILPIAIMSSLSMYCMRDLIVDALFTVDFSPVKSLFLGQVIGDVFKIGSWMIAYVMLGKAMIKYFIVTEVIFSVSFYLMVVLMTSRFGFEGVSWAYAINYLVYWVIMYVFIFKTTENRAPICSI